MNSDFKMDEFNSVYQRAQSFFSDLNTPFSWVVNEENVKNGLLTHLNNKGFVLNVEVECLALNLNHWKSRKDLKHQIFIIDNFSDMLEALKLNEDFKEYSNKQLEDSAHKFLKDPHSQWFAVKDSQAVIATSSLTFEDQIKIVNFSGATTLKTFRQQGLYSDLLGFRLNLAKEKGYLWATCQAIADTSAPILKQFGFHKITRLIAYQSTQN